MKVLAYLRVSTRRQEAASQERPVLERAVSLSKAGDTVVTIDEKKSGRSLERPGWSRVMSECRARRVRCVVVWSVTRVTRQMLELVAVVRELRSLGVELHSVSEPWLSSTGIASDVVLSVLGFVAELERQQISVNTIAGLERVRRVGSRSGLAIGRPRKDEAARAAVAWLAADRDRTIGQAQKKFGVSRSTIDRARQKGATVSAAPLGRKLRP